MKSAIIVHGMPPDEDQEKGRRTALSNREWIPWLQERLLKKGILAQTPEFPHPQTPVYEAWKKVFEQFEIKSDTLLVGHSCGAGFLARWLSENSVRVGTVALVAPWMDPPPRRLKNGFFEFTLDPKTMERTKEILIFSSKDDHDDIQKSVALLERTWPNARHIEFNHKGHFTKEDMNTTSFPELESALLD